MTWHDVTHARIKIIIFYQLDWIGLDCYSLHSSSSLVVLYYNRFYYSIIVSFNFQSLRLLVLVLDVVVVVVVNKL